MNADYMILNCDARDVPLPDESVHLIVTSPPYWGLRKYAGEQELVWGGDADCRHEWIDTPHTDKRGIEGSGLNGRDPYKGGEARLHYVERSCGLCSAWKGSLGLEPTVQMYVDHIVQIFREMRRILRKDGVVFLNIGDSYVASATGSTGKRSTLEGGQSTQNEASKRPSKSGNGLKAKDLCMVPARVALALQADGWWIRSDIIWAKGMSFDDDYVGNPMCESVNDRPSRAHEYVFMLTKSQKYYWDKYAVLEAGKDWGKRDRSETFSCTDGVMPNGQPHGGLKDANFAERGRNLRNVWSISTSPLGWEMCSQCKVAMPAKLYRRLPKVDIQIDDKVVTKRQCGCESTDWMSHFAAFPQKLIEPMVKAGTSEHGCCADCGAPWKRMVERTAMVIARSGRNEASGIQIGASGTMLEPATSTTTGWQPSCKCTDADIEPCTVFDPFTGSGTSAIVACKLGRKFIGTELSDDYVCLAEQRIAYTLENK